MLKHFVRIIRGDFLHRKELAISCKKLGSPYGAHTIALNELNPSSVIYSFGIGEDASFDLKVIEMIGCPVYAFDPTPKSIAWVNLNINEPLFKFSPIGIAEFDGNASVTAPENPEHVSHGRATGQDADLLEFPVQRLDTIVGRLKHNSIDVLKMDIEGFEYEVLPDILQGDVLPKQMLVEFHHQMYGFSKQDTKRSVDQLHCAGYRIFSISETGREYSFQRI